MNSKNIALHGILISVMLALSIVESVLSPPNLFNIRIGLSNIVIMYCLFFMDKKDVIFFSIIKSIFVFISRGTMAGILSFGGGVLSICVMAGLLLIFGQKISYILISVFGAIFHNIGQIVLAATLLKNPHMLYYLGISLLPAVITGIITGILLKSLKAKLF